MLKSINPHEALARFVQRYPTQKAAADALGIGAVYLGDLLRGRRTMGPKMLAKLGLQQIVVPTKKSA